MCPRYTFYFILILKPFAPGSHVHCGRERDGHPPFDHPSDCLWPHLGQPWVRGAFHCHPRTGRRACSDQSTGWSNRSAANSSSPLSPSNSASYATSSPGEFTFKIFESFAFLKVHFSGEFTFKILESFAFLKVHFSGDHQRVNRPWDAGSQLSRLQPGAFQPSTTGNYPCVDPDQLFS